MERRAQPLLVTPLLVFALLWTPSDAAAQSPPTATIAAPHAGDCRVEVTFSPALPRAVVGLLLNLGPLEPQVVDAGTTSATFETRRALVEHDELRVLVNGAAVAEASVQAADPNRPPTGMCAEQEEPSGSAWESFSASAYLGMAVDSFAPDSVGDYRNPQAADQRKTRQIFGVNFDYRLFGGDGDHVQLWLYGETLHGVRTADVDCEGETPPPVCSEASPFQDRAFYILQHASSLEAYVAPRLELWTLQRGSTTPTKVYVTTRIGFTALERAPSVYKSLHVGVGLLADDGPFAGSSLEVGWGQNELFARSDWNRLKIDGLLIFSIERIIRTDAARFFVQMYIDNDPWGDGADSIQTFYGIDVDLQRVFGW